MTSIRLLQRVMELKVSLIVLFSACRPQSNQLWSWSKRSRFGNRNRFTGKDSSQIVCRTLWPTTDQAYQFANTHGNISFYIEFLQRLVRRGVGGFRQRQTVGSPTIQHRSTTFAGEPKCLFKSAASTTESSIYAGMPGLMYRQMFGEFDERCKYEVCTYFPPGA